MQVLIKKHAQAIEPDLIKWRRLLHTMPELGFQEFKTANQVAQILKNLGLDVKEKVGQTGIVGLLKGDKPGKTVALRADMDALPITEQNTHQYVSTNVGVMHACGHDAHMAILLGAAKVLADLKNELTGNVKFIFQPCEEEPPGGATEMIKDKVLENPVVDGIFGLHVDPLYPVGTVGYKEGTMMAAVDNFYIEIIGKAGHVALPNKAVDAIQMAAEVVQALKSIPERQKTPHQPLILSIGTINGGYKDNIIADSVAMTGTVRTLNPVIRKEIPQIMEKTIKSITAAYKGDYKFDYEYSYPALINDKEMTQIFRQAAGEITGRAKVLPIGQPSMGGEDFAYYAEKVPAAFVNLGVGFSDRENFSLHHPKFDINEKALSLGTAILANVAYKFLTQ